ncbi:MAG: hypothetical protein ACC630_08330 [Nitrospinota bacterium]
MKCPKCGYVSFEYLDECRKCGRDLVKFKEDAGIYMVMPGSFGGPGLAGVSSMEVAEDVAVAEENDETVSEESHEDEGGIVMSMETETSSEVEIETGDTRMDVEEESTADKIEMEDVSLDMGIGDELLEGEVSGDDIAVVKSPDETLSGESQEDEGEIVMSMETETSPEVGIETGDTRMGVEEGSAGSSIDTEDKKEEPESFVSADEEYGDIDIDNIDIDIGDDDIPSDDEK